ncbi:MAG: D-alanyl-D-alanine carboxypeptidase [Candidatus Berkelbacteria bacterium]|nr:MAG: D-alanyl-D-alanine carboxypeptidase [Candidatus Berkelbacteria bacterium]QQG52129.1 MAG: D-alanyl-D-alanine carboxypeptidase [Candidatus Berkelbacteria bacterium]
MLNSYVKTPTRHRPRILSLVTLLVILFLLRSGSTAPIASASGSTETASLASLDSVEEYLAVKDKAPAAPIYAKSYILMDGETGDILVNRNGDLSIPIASTTKMITALTAVENLKLDDVTTTTAFPTRIEGSKVNLLTDEKITVLNLLKALLINSGNDSAFAIAEAYSGKTGDYQTFVKKMNEFVAKNGLKNTVLSDPAGLDDEKGRSTPRELAHIARILLKNEALSKIVSTPQEVVTSVNGQQRHELKNTNRLIQSDTPYYMPNALGVKTGFTHEAGHSLVAAYRLGDRLLIGVVMNTAEYTNTASAAEMKKLFLWAEQNLAKKKYLELAVP